nr:class I SAM-dependent methyltransferase [Bdellovibrio sp. NC01]
MGLVAANEWPELKKLLPDLKGLKVLDLGCGYGWHCRYLKENGAAHVIGLDLSFKMLEKARQENGLDGVEYIQGAIEDISFKDAEFDLVFSSLAFHYVEDFDRVCKTIQRILKNGGKFVFSTEHPVFTARKEQDWARDINGKIQHWPVDGYHQIGKRHTSWLADDVIKYHRTFSSILDSLLSAGFEINKIAEPTLTEDTLKQHPEWSDEIRRPMFLLIAATKKPI